MNTMIRKLAAAAALACLVPVASADVLNFDDMTGGPLPFSSAYHGFTFTYITGSRTAACSYCVGSWYWDDHNDVAPDAKNYFKSPSTSMWTDYDQFAVPSHSESKDIKAAAPVTFDGAYFTSVFDGGDVTFNMYLGGLLVHTSATLLNMQRADAPAYLASGYAGLVDTITVTGWNGYYAMDNFTFTTVTVPEPSSYALILAGLAALRLTYRRRPAAKA